MDRLPLALLRRGMTARVRELIGDPLQVHRLRELGMQEGAEIEMVQSGSPCIVRLGASKLCFRPDEMLGVLVAPGAAACS